MRLRFLSAGHFVVYIALLFLLPACHHTRRVVNTTPVTPEKPRTALEACKDKQLIFNTLTAGGRAVADIPNLGNGVTLSYRIQIQRDKAILIRVNKLIEVVRIYITPDSIVALDRLNSRALIAGFGMAQEFTGLDADFAMLQDLLLGNLRIIPDTMQETGMAGEAHTYTGTQSGVLFTYEALLSTCRPQRMEAKNEAKNQHTQVSYPTFMPVGKQLVAKNIQVQVFAPQKASISLEHSSLVLDEPDFSINFSIPDGYEIVRK